MKITIKNLHNDYIDTKPIDADWNGEQFDYDQTGNGWSSWDCAECDTCGTLHVGHGEREERCSDLDPDGESECEGNVSFSCPMMSYYYPLQWKDESDAKKLRGLPLCLVEVNGNRGIALTGGGMDLSWEIARAYIALGYLPPVHFRLPVMAGPIPQARTVLAAMARSASIAMNWARNNAREVRHVRKALKERGTL